MQQALKKLDRMNVLNKVLAQDRIDQWQIEKLAYRQDMLAQQLKNLLENEPLSDAELARQIEAIRQEQARLAEQQDVLEKQNAAVKKSLEALAQKEMQRLAQSAEQMAAEQRKMGDGQTPDALKERLDKLAAELKELTQKPGDPEAAAMAKESIAAIEQAKKAIDSSDAMKATGDAEQAKIADDEAAKKLDIVVKQLAKLARDQSDEATGRQRRPEENRRSRQGGRQDDEDGGRQTARDAQECPTRHEGGRGKAGAGRRDGSTTGVAPSPQGGARQPTAKTTIPLGGARSGTSSKVIGLEAFQGKAWGELPGELKTRLMQDVRSRFGEEYADLIQAYFESLAESPQSSGKR